MDFVQAPRRTDVQACDDGPPTGRPGRPRCSFLKTLRGSNEALQLNQHRSGGECWIRALRPSVAALGCSPDVAMVRDVQLQTSSRTAYLRLPNRLVRLAMQLRSMSERLRGKSPRSRRLQRPQPVRA